jgi:dipeptide/tripeptide permease
MRLFRDHPPGLFVCAATEMWERFSYYGMRALLVFFLTQHFLFTDDQGFLIYGAYTALVYLAPIVGGAISDRWLGARKAIVLGGVLLVLGHFGMAIEGPPAVKALSGGQETVVRDQRFVDVFYLSLSLIIVGVGFLKTNASALVGALYPPGDRRRDSGFTVFYMCYNLGGAVAPFVCGWLGQRYGWRYGFGLAGIGMIGGLIVFLRGQHHLAGAAEPPDPARLRERILPGLTRELAIYLGTVALVGLTWLLMHRQAVVGQLLSVFGLGTGAWIDVYTEPRSAGGAILPALGLAGVATAGVAIADHHSPFKYGVPQSIVTGMYVGLYEGISWSLWNQARSTRRDQWEDKTVASVVWGSAAVGALTGGIVGTLRGTTPGRASYDGSAALWSSLVGGLLGAALSKDDDRADDNALLASAVALNAGALAGMLTASSVSPSIARVRFIDLGGIAGGLLFGGIYLAAADRKPEVSGFSGLTAVGIATGVGIAYFATAGMTPDRSPGETAQKKETFLGSLAGGLAPTKGGGIATVSAMF